MPSDSSTVGSGLFSCMLLYFSLATNQENTLQGERAIMSIKIAVIYYSATGNVYQLARAVAEGAVQAGAEVRLRRVHELAPEEAIAQNPLWKEHYEATRETVPEREHSRKRIHFVSPVLTKTYWLLAAL